MCIIGSFMIISDVIKIINIYFFLNKIISNVINENFNLLNIFVMKKWMKIMRNKSMKRYICYILNFLYFLINIFKRGHS